MHRNEARPHPLPPFRASASGTRPAPLDTQRYFWTELDAFAWADGQNGVNTVFIEETLDRYPYCWKGRRYDQVSPGVWLREADTELAGLSATGQQTAEMR